MAKANIFVHYNNVSDADKMNEQNPKLSKIITIRQMSLLITLKRLSKQVQRGEFLIPSLKLVQQSCS